VRAPRPKSVQHQSINERQANCRPCSSDFERNGNGGYHNRSSQPPMTGIFNGDDPMSLSLPNVLGAEELKVK
jgi:hypothetical protein